MTQETWTNFCRHPGLIYLWCSRVWQEAERLHNPVFQPLTFQDLSQCLAKGFTQACWESPAISWGNPFLASSPRKLGSWSGFSLRHCVGPFFVHWLIYLRNILCVVWMGVGRTSYRRHCAECCLVRLQWWIRLDTVSVHRGLRSCRRGRQSNKKKSKQSDQTMIKICEKCPKEKVHRTLTGTTNLMWRWGSVREGFPAEVVFETWDIWERGWGGGSPAAPSCSKQG